MQKLRNFNEFVFVYIKTNTKGKFIFKSLQLHNFSSTTKAANKS